MSALQHTTMRRPFASVNGSARSLTQRHAVRHMRGRVEQRKGSFRRVPVLDVVCQATRWTADDPHITLGTATIPRSANLQMFTNSLYQWASSITSSGANLPMSLPLKVDRMESGFQITLLRRSKDGGFFSTGDIIASVEDEADRGSVLFIRFYEGSSPARSSSNDKEAAERLETLLSSLVDVPTIMSTMPAAIRRAVAVATTSG
eukprot:jgi/Chrzof1/5068/Cz15g10180.t1